MEKYTKLKLRTAYQDGCLDIAQKLSTRVWEHAKYNPDSFDYQEKIFINRLMAEGILQNLKNAFGDVLVTMDYIPETNSEGMATYRFNWS